MKKRSDSCLGTTFKESIEWSSKEEIPLPRWGEHYFPRLYGETWYAQCVSLPLVYSGYQQIVRESGNTKSQLHVTEEVGIGHQVKIISCRGKKNFELTQNAAQRTSSILVCKYPCLFQISLLTTLRSGMALLKRELSCHPCCCHLLLPLTLPYWRKENKKKQSPSKSVKNFQRLGSGLRNLSSKTSLPVLVLLVSWIWRTARSVLICVLFKHTSAFWCKNLFKYVTKLS